MTLLAIDTSTEWGSIAVFDGTAVLAEQTWRARRHDDALFPSIERLLELVGLSLPSIDRVAVAIRPGSFTVRFVPMQISTSCACASSRFT